MSLTHIETIELGSSQSSITFSSIPQDYDDLKLLVSGRSDRNNNEDTISLRFNGESTDTNYSGIFLQKEATAVVSRNASVVDNAFVGSVSGALATSNTFGNGSIYISNYTFTSDKSISSDLVQEENTDQQFMGIFTTLYTGTSAISSIEIFVNFGTNLVSGSTFSLYGITAGGDGTVSTA